MLTGEAAYQEQARLGREADYRAWLARREAGRRKAAAALAASNVPRRKWWHIGKTTVKPAPTSVAQDAPPRPILRAPRLKAMLNVVRDRPRAK